MSALAGFDTESAARKLADCMDYPWDHMTEQGREAMRKHAKAIISAAQPEIDLKAQNDRMLEFLKDISRTSGDKGTVMGARILLEEFAP